MDKVFVVARTEETRKLLSSVYQEESSDISPIVGFVVPYEEAVKYDNVLLFKIPDNDPEMFVCNYWDGDITIEDMELIST